MLRRLLIAVLVLLLAGVVVVDRVGARAAAHVLAGQLQSDEHLQERPSVSVGGVPFLTQVFGGKYDDVSVTAHNYKTSDGVTVTTLKAHLRGAHIPFSKVVKGSVKSVPVDRVDGSAFVSFGDLSKFLATTGLTVTLSRESSRSINLTGRVPLGGHVRLVHSVVSVSVNHSVVTLSGPARVRGVSVPLAVTIPFRSLPFRFTVSSVTIAANGISGTGTAKHVTLGG
jgi:hypothetical protein